MKANFMNQYFVSASQKQFSHSLGLERNYRCVWSWREIWTPTILLERMGISRPPIPYSNDDAQSCRRFTPGTLLIFGGQKTIHRVTEVKGTRPRLVPVLCYSVVPDLKNSDEVRKLFWGRTGRETAAYTKSR